MTRASIARALKARTIVVATLLVAVSCVPPPDNEPPGTTSSTTTTSTSSTTTSTTTTTTTTTTPPAEPTRISVVGDYGYNHPYILELGSLVDRLDPDAVATTGDNLQIREMPGYQGTDKYDRLVGRHFCRFMAGVAPGPHCPSGGDSPVNRFFPSAGNHDHDDGPLETYLDYFDLPGAGATSTHPTGSELYYDVLIGDVHVFVVDSESVSIEEEGGVPPVPTAAQRAWLETALGESPAPWQVVVMHEPPFGSSAEYGSTPHLQWPYAQWGADLVLNGHAAVYERVHRGGIPYVTNGLGGGYPGSFGTPIFGSMFRYAEDVATTTLLTATPTSLRLELVTVEDEVIDTHVITAP